MIYHNFLTVFRKENISGSKETALSCKTKESATHLQPSLSFDYAKDSDLSEGFDCKSTFLNKFDFTIPCKGETPVYCGMPYLAGIAKDGSGGRVIYTSCDTMACPKCGRLWQLQRVYEAAVHVECYARYLKNRPAHGQGSIDSGKDYSLDDIRKVGRSIIGRLKRQGVNAGLKFLHPFRIKDNVKRALKQIIGKSSSSGFWKFIRDDYKNGNIEKINEIIHTDYKSWIDCVFFSPHYHFISFPGNQKFTGNKKIVLKKESYWENGKKVWTLRDVEAVVKYLTYLISHTGQLVNKKQFIKIITPFGDMHKKKAEDLVSSDELAQIRLEVLEVLNRGRDKKLEIDDGTIKYSLADEEKEKIEFYPMSEFRLKTLEAQENTRAFISGARRSYGAEHADYLKYVIDLWNYIQDNSDIPSNYKKLFLTPFESPPCWVCVLDSDSQSMFESGLAEPPESFKFYLQGNLKT